MKNFLSITDLSKNELLALIKKAQLLKKKPKKYHKALYEKTLMTFFQLPSLRTEVSFDVAMFKMGGEIIDYHAETSPWAKGKESIADVSRVISRYCDIIMIRIPDHNTLLKFAKVSSIPVINGLTKAEHPCQIVADLMTIVEKKKKVRGIKLAYVGDANNNVTYSLMLASKMVGLEMVIGCPKKKAFSPIAKLVKKTKVKVLHDPFAAVKDADVVYTDSWMSYAIPASEKKKRLKVLKPFQVNPKLMAHAKKNAIFMHCLPAKRGEEVTSSVMDGKQSVVFDQAENRLHTEKAILLKLLKK